MPFANHKLSIGNRKFAYTQPENLEARLFPDRRIPGVDRVHDNAGGCLRCDFGRGHVTELCVPDEQQDCIRIFESLFK